jgi:hypothetical protein
MHIQAIRMSSNTFMSHGLQSGVFRSRMLVMCGEIAMRKYRTTVLAAGLLLTATAPVFAQAAIQEPGMFAFYHPNLDALNGGAPTPEYFLEQRSRVRGSGYSTINRANAWFRAQRYRPYDPATGTFISNGGRRHARK